LYFDADNPKEAFRNRTVPPYLLAKVVIEGDSLPMKLPDPAVWTAWVTKLYATTPELNDITDAELKAGGDRKRTLTFRHEGPRVFYADDKTFQENRIDQHIPLNAVEKWLVVAAKDGHPFHIHINPFQVQVPYSDGTKPWVWRDTLFIAEGQTATVRMRFLDYDGKTVLHCHNLDHEDQGMMQAIQIETTPAVTNTGSTAGRGLGKVPWPSPAWTLDGADGGRFRSTDFQGRLLLLVFHRGLDCLHCAEQLQRLAATEASFRDLGVAIVAVSPRYPAADALRDSRDALGFRFPLLCDPTLRVFRDFGCAGPEPLHGVFLVDGLGVVRWQEVGDSPQTDMNRILEQVRRLAPPPAATTH
jgi:peroxiredoxin